MVSSIDVEVRVAIVGAGPHGLAAALHLLGCEPTLIDDLVVVDPAGWLGIWHDQFARLDIDRLRSPGVHHPGCDAHALDRWRKRNGVPDRHHYGIPNTDTFTRFCRDLIDDAGLAEHVVPTRARGVAAGPHPSRVELTDGTTVAARHVILAVNPARRRLPHWAFDALPVPPHRMVHADDIDLRVLDLTGESVIVIGGGLTAAHLAVGAARRGARVTVLARRPLRESMFDTDPGWLGPMYLDGFGRIDDPARRLEACLAARDGGSVTPWMMRRLHDLMATGRLEIVAPARVCASRSAHDGIELVLGDETIRRADRVWLATGTEPDVTAHRITAQLADEHPIPLSAGWPHLDAQLRWPGTNVHLLGRPAMLRLGPAAGNLWGARVGARVVADHISVSRAMERSRSHRFHPAGGRRPQLAPNRTRQRDRSAEDRAPLPLTAIDLSGESE
jgi:glycine/D-amino acid oxidase-like deaminating enzyme